MCRVHLSELIVGSSQPGNALFEPYSPVILEIKLPWVPKPYRQPLGSKPLPGLLVLSIGYSQSHGSHRVQYSFRALLQVVGFTARVWGFQVRANLQGTSHWTVSQ